MKTALYEIKNEATQMTAFVFKNSKSGYNVTVRDDDSGQFLNTAFCGLETLDMAIEKAKISITGD